MRGWPAAAKQVRTALSALIQDKANQLADKAVRAPFLNAPGEEKHVFWPAMWYSSATRIHLRSDAFRRIELPTHGCQRGTAPHFPVLIRWHRGRHHDESPRASRRLV